MNLASHQKSFLSYFFIGGRLFLLISGLITLCALPPCAYNNTKKEATVGMKITSGMLATDTSYRTPYTIFHATQGGPVMMIAAGIHGNETASIKAAQNLITKLNTGKISLHQGTLIVTPIMNKKAYLKRIRGVPDLNRTFPQYASGFATHSIAKDWMALARKYKPSWYLDLHEANGLSQLNSKYLGQTLIVNNGNKATGSSKKIISRLNHRVSNKAHHFNLKVKPLGGSSRMAMVQSFNAASVTVETCWSLPFLQRVEYQEDILLQFLKAAKMR